MGNTVTPVELPKGIFRRQERRRVDFLASQPMRSQMFARFGDLGGGALRGLIGRFSGFCISEVHLL